MRRFLSWDCGNKTLAHAHVSINTTIMIYCAEYETRLRNWIDRHGATAIAEWIRGECAETQAMQELFDAIAEMQRAIKSFIAFHSVGVADILDGRKVADTDEVQRTLALVKYLAESPVSNDVLAREDRVYSSGTKILIEHQPSKVGQATNNKSTMIGHQLMFYYAAAPIALVSPKLKNKISIPGIVFSPTYGGAASPYYARKKHSKDLFLRLIEVLGLEYICKGVPKSCMDDLADAVMQIFAHCREEGVFARVIVK